MNQLQPGETSAESVRRIWAAWLDDTIERLSEVELTDGAARDAAIHDARKTLKRLRALARLVRGGLPQSDYGRANTTFRDAARALAPLRDSAVLVETFDKLVDAQLDRLSPQVLAQMRAVLTAQRASVAHAVVREQRTVQRVVTTLREARVAVDAQTVVGDGFALFDTGLTRLYRRGREAMLTAYADDAADAFHEWRKSVKYLWYAYDVLRPIAPVELGAAVKRLKAISRLLGDAHDLHVLAVHLTDVAVDVDAGSLETLVGLCHERRRALEAEAAYPGLRLYARRPAATVAGWRAAYAAW